MVGSLSSTDTRGDGSFRQAFIIDFRITEDQTRPIKRLNVISFYLVLTFISLPIPLFQRNTDKIIEGMRPAYKMEDGTYVGGLLPGELMGMKEAGHLSWIVLFVVIGSFALSFFLKFFSEIETVCAIAVCQSAFMSFYAMTMLIVFMVRYPG